MKVVYGKSIAMETSHGTIMKPNIEIPELRDLLKRGEAKFTLICQYGMHLNVYLNHYNDVIYDKASDGTVKFTMAAADGTLVTIENCPVSMIGEYEVWKAVWVKHEKPTLPFELLGSAKQLEDVEALADIMYDVVDTEHPIYTHVDPEDINLEENYYTAREVYEYHGTPYMFKMKYTDSEQIDREILWIASCSTSGRYELDLDALADLAISNAVGYEST